MNIFGIRIKLPKLFQTVDKRKFERVRVFETLYLDYQSDRPPVKGSSKAKDISLGGLRFTSDQKIPKGSLLQLNLRFAAGSTSVKSLTTQAHVVRCSKKMGHKHYQVGCIFDPLDEASRVEIENFIHWLKERNEKYLFFRYRGIKED